MFDITVTLQELKGVHKNKQSQELKMLDGMKNGKLIQWFSSNVGFYIP